MTYTPADVPGFSGLDLADVEDARGAIEATDCYVHPDGRLVPRPGFAARIGRLFPASTVYPSSTLYPNKTGQTFSSTNNSNGSLAFRVAGLNSRPAEDRVVVGDSSTVRLYTAEGLLKTSLSADTGGLWSFTAASGSGWGANGATTLIQATTTTLTRPTCGTRKLTEQIGVFAGKRTMPKPLYVSVQTPDNRLVAAGYAGVFDGPNGTATTPATIFFSQADDPLKWDETEFEIVGDANDPIIGLANWADYLIVFKAQEWYVFYGNSVRSDATGLAVFNYRKVEAGCTVLSSVAGSKGLYVMDSDGNIRATTGGTPQIIFTGDTTRYAPRIAQGFRAGKFIGFPVTSGYLVLDEDNGRVFYWTLPLNAGTTLGDQALFPYSTGLAAFPEGTTDDQSTVTASYVSPYSSWGEAGVEKSVRQTVFHGTGNLKVSWAKDLQSHGFPRSVAMKFGKGLDRNAVRGETLSYKITGSGFTLNRLVPMLREQRPSGVRT